jgi:hypothetical protein
MCITDHGVMCHHSSPMELLLWSGLDDAKVIIYRSLVERRRAAYNCAMNFDLQICFIWIGESWYMYHSHPLVSEATIFCKKCIKSGLWERK